MSRKNRKQLPRVGSVIRWLLAGIGVVVVSAFVALVVSTPPDRLDFIVEPDRLSVGDVSEEWVELSGRQCFSAPNVRTFSDETWRHDKGSESAPNAFEPFYRAGDLTVEYGSGVDAIPLDSSGCASFERFRQPIPLLLRQDLAVACFVPSMYVELVLEASDVETGTTSRQIIWRSDPFDSSVDFRPFAVLIRRQRCMRSPRPTPSGRRRSGATPPETAPVAL